MGYMKKRTVLFYIKLYKIYIIKANAEHVNIIWSPQKPLVRQSKYPQLACAETETEGR